MKRILLAAAIGVAPWIAQANQFAECVEQFESNPHCALELAEAYSNKYWPDQRPVVRASRALVEAGRIDAAKRLLPILKNEQDQYTIDFAILEFFAKERRFGEQAGEALFLGPGSLALRHRGAFLLFGSLFVPAHPPRIG